MVKAMLADAGLPSGLQVRDPRRSGATELGEAGATDDELRAVTAHATREVVGVYVLPHRSGMMAANAMKKRADWTKNRKKLENALETSWKNSRTSVISY